jgi:hypothetical protein
MPGTAIPIIARDKRLDHTGALDARPALARAVRIARAAVRVWRVDAAFTGITGIDRARIAVVAARGGVAATCASGWIAGIRRAAVAIVAIQRYLGTANSRIAEPHRAGVADSNHSAILTSVVARVITPHVAPSVTRLSAAYCLDQVGEPIGASGSECVPLAVTVIVEQGCVRWDDVVDVIDGSERDREHRDRVALAGETILAIPPVAT